MPKLPIVQRTSQVPSLELPRPGAQSFGLGIGKGLEELGQTLGKIDDEIRAVEEAEAGEKILTESAQSLDDEYERLTREADHNTFLPSFSEFRQKVHAEAQERVKSLSRQAQASLIPHIERVTGSYQARANQKSRELKVTHSVAETMESLPVLAGLAAKAETPEDRAYWEGMGRGRIRGLKIDEVRRVEIGQQWQDRVASAREKYWNGPMADRLNELSNKAATEPENAPLYQREAFNLIDSADWMPDEKRAEAKTAAGSQIWLGAVKTLIDRDPVGTDKALKEGRFNKLVTPQALLTLRNEAENEIERRQKKAEAERKERERQIGKVVADFEDAKMAGFDWRGPVSEAQLANLVKGTEHEAKFLNIAGASGFLEKFNRLPATQREDVLRRTAAGAKTGFEAKFIGTLTKAHEAASAALEKDPLTFAVKQRVIPAPPPFNLQDPATLHERSRLAGIVESYYGRPISPLSDDEVDQLRITIDQAPADSKTAILRSLRAGLEDRQIKAVAGQLAKKKEDNVMALALGISVEAPQTASRILRGREILKENPKINPGGTDLASARDRINQGLGEAYMHNPEHHGALSEAVMALYAQRSWQERDLSGVLNTRRIDEAVSEATGGLLTISKGFLRGGYKIQPPRRGMTESQFTDLLKGADYKGAKGLKAEDIQRHGIFESVGDGRYLVRVGPGYVQGEKGPFILDLSRVR